MSLDDFSYEKNIAPSPIETKEAPILEEPLEKYISKDSDLYKELLEHIDFKDAIKHTDTCYDFNGNKINKEQTNNYYMELGYSNVINIYLPWGTSICSFNITEEDEKLYLSINRIYNLEWLEEINTKERENWIWKFLREDKGTQDKIKLERSEIDEIDDLDKASERLMNEMDEVDKNIKQTDEALRKKHEELDNINDQRDALNSLRLISLEAILWQAWDKATEQDTKVTSDIIMNFLLLCEEGKILLNKEDIQKHTTTFDERRDKGGTKDDLTQEMLDLYTLAKEKVQQHCADIARKLLEKK